jgi:hypothetical protein
MNSVFGLEFQFWVEFGGLGLGWLLPEPGLGVVVEAELSTGDNGLFFWYPMIVIFNGVFFWLIVFFGFHFCWCLGRWPSLQILKLEI